MRITNFAASKPRQTFVLRVDASKYAVVGAALEQLLDEERCPTKEDVLNRKTVPVAFMSRKLTGSQRNWVPREQETYAIVLALLKWQSWIGFQEVLVLTIKHLKVGTMSTWTPPQAPQAAGGGGMNFPPIFLQG